MRMLMGKILRCMYTLFCANRFSHWRPSRLLS